MFGPTEKFSKALAILRSHGVVGMPTETVYGLAADARSSDAVAKIFALKGRPSTNPLIVHVASVEIGERYAIFDDRARMLFAKFAPGPLTIVLPKRGGNSSPHPSPLPEGVGAGHAISPLVSAGLNTVGIRIPNHPVALELLRAFDGPLAAPSANKSNHVSPTTAQHVRDEFGEDLLVLDGGPCRVGLESTVIDLTKHVPTILRPGEITRGQIEAVIGAVALFSGHVDASTAAHSPGQQRVHYAPRTPAYRFEYIEDARQRFAGTPLVGVITILGPVDEHGSQYVVWNIGDSPQAAASAFYAALREIDSRAPGVILIELPPNEPKWSALRDRIIRATKPLAELD